MVIISSKDTPTILGLEIEPDWANEVFEIEEFLGSTLKRTDAGKEQRISTRAKPRRTMRYGIASSRIAAQTDLIATLVTLSRSPLLVPWWPDGLRLAITMGDEDTLQLEIPPGACHDITVGTQLLVGAIPREVAAIDSKFVDLVSDPAGQIEPVGTWVFPLRLAMMTDASSALTRLRYDESAQSLQFSEI